MLFNIADTFFPNFDEVTFIAQDMESQVWVVSFKNGKFRSLTDAEANILIPYLTENCMRPE